MGAPHADSYGMVKHGLKKKKKKTGNQQPPLFNHAFSTTPFQPHLFNHTFFYILQRGVQWKQGVVICMTLYTSLLYNTTPIHCTPPSTAPPSAEYPTFSTTPFQPHLNIYIYIYIYIYTYTFSLYT